MWRTKGSGPGQEKHSLEGSTKQKAADRTQSLHTMSVLFCGGQAHWECDLGQHQMQRKMKLILQDTPRGQAAGNTAPLQSRPRTTLGFGMQLLWEVNVSVHNLNRI